MRLSHIIRALLCFGAALPLAACEPEEGSFRIVFEWQDGPPEDPEALFVYGVVQEAPDDGASQTLASFGPEAYRSGLSLDFDDVPIGANRQVIVELRAEPGKAAQVVYYGISERFAMKAGDDVVVPVRVALVHAPGFGERGEDVGIAIRDLVTVYGEPGYATSPEVTLRLISDSAVAVELSNLPGLPSPEIVELADDNAVEDDELASGLSAHEVTWDLDEGLAEPCGEVDYCNRRVFARFIDAEDYRSPVYDVEVVVDSKPPGIVASTVDLRLQPADGNALVLEGLSERVERVASGTAVRLAFALDEVVPEEPLVVAASDERELAFECDGNGAAFVCEHIYETDEPVESESFVVRVQAVDKAGTESTIELATTFEVDTVAPGAPSEPDGDAQLLVYERAPWGRDGAAVPYFALRAASGSVEPASTVLVLDGPDPESAQRIGRADADDEGGFEAVALTLADRAEIYALVLDAAGNRRSSATLIRDVEWTAGFGETPLGNPHTFDSRQYFLSTLEQADARVANVAVASAGEDDGIELARGAGRFRRGSPIAAPDGRTFTAITFDRARGKAVSIGGRAFSASCDDSGSARCDRVIEWDGNAFAQRVITGDRPSARDGVGLTWDARRGHTLLFGGKSEVGAAMCMAGSAICGDTWSFDGDAFTLLDAGGDEGSPEQRTSPALVYDSRRGVSVLFGGLTQAFFGSKCDQQTGYCGDTWEWDGEQWTERVALADLAAIKPTPRANHAMAYDEARGVTLLFGGAAPRLFGDQDPANDETWTWDGEQWTRMLPPDGAPPQPAPRADAAMTFSRKLGRVVLFGGQSNLGIDCDGSGTVFCDQLWSWNGAYWEPIEEPAPQLPAPVGRAGAVMVEDAFGNLLLFGGRRTLASAAGDCTSAQGGCSGVWLFEGRHWRERSGALEDPVRKLASARFDMAMTYDAETGRTLAFGGQSALSNECEGTVLPPAIAEAWQWDGNAWTPVELAAGQSARRGAALVTQSAGPLLLGGWLSDEANSHCDGAGEPFCEATWSYDAGAFTSATPVLASAPDARRDAAVALLGDGAALIFGGRNDTGALADAWVLDAGVWNDASDGAPAARYGAVLGYDAERDQALLFGGGTVGEASNMCPLCRCPSAGTYAWDGAEWTALEPEHAPAPRVDAALAYASSREALVLFGGAAALTGDANNIRDDLWEWQGDDWYRIEPADPEGDGHPALRAQHAMVADEARGELLVFGGVADPSQSTWIWYPGADARPAQVARFDFETTGAPSTAQLRGLDLTWAAGAESTEGDGVILQAWSEGSFEAVDDLGFERDGDHWTALDGDVLSALPYGTRRELAFALMPAASNGTRPGYASIGTDFVEISVSYRLPEP